MENTGCFLKYRIKRILFWALFAFFITGCSVKPQRIVPTISHHPITPSPVTYTATNTPTKDIPSATKTVILTQASTITPNPIYLTQEATVLSCASTEKDWYSKFLSTAYYTNANWRAVICSDDDVYTKVWNPSYNLTWHIPVYSSNDYDDTWWYWEPYLWSENGKYLYLEARCPCYIDSPWLIYANGFGIARLDLLSGQFSIWLQPSAIPWYNFAFTPDGNYFAFSPLEYPDTIKIRDLESGKEKTLGFKSKYSILEYRFTPDASRLVIFVEERKDKQDKNVFSVFVYYVNTDFLKKIMNKENLNSTFSDDLPRIYISKLSNDVLFLADIFEEYSFELNIQTGELATINK